MKKFVLAGAASLLSLLALAQAGDETTFELLASIEGGEKSYAVINNETGKTAVAEINGKKVIIVTGEKAKAASEALRSELKMPAVVKFEGKQDFAFSSDGDDTSHVMVFKSDDGEDTVVQLDGDVLKREGDQAIFLESDGSKVTKKSVKIIEFDENSSPEEIEKALKEAGVDPSVLSDTPEGKAKKIIIKKMNEDMTVDVEDGTDLSWEDEDGMTVDITKEDNGTTVRKTVRVIRADAPQAPDAPATPMTPEAPTEMKWEEKSVSKSVMKSVQDHGTEIEQIRMTGVSEKDAKEFIDDIDGLSKAQKDKLRAVLKS